jgi:hypothetical protein
MLMLFAALDPRLERNEYTAATSYKEPHDALKSWILDVKFLIGFHQPNCYIPRDGKGDLY